MRFVLMIMSPGVKFVVLIDHQCSSYRGTRFSLPGSLALGVQHSEPNADLRTYALLGTPSVNRFSRSMTTISSLRRMGAGWRLLWRLIWLIA
jgi:hypothetical protein